MSDNAEFLKETSLKGLIAAGGGRADHSAIYQKVMPQLRALCGDEVAALFAEPVPPSQPDPDNPVLAWYTSRDGQMIELFSIDDLARAPIVSALRNKLQRLKPALDSPEIGAIVASWLNIPSRRSILAVGGHPVLIEWGFLPAEEGQTPLQREGLFARTLGPYLPDAPTPPFTAEEQGAYSAQARSRVRRRQGPAPGPAPGAAAASVAVEGDAPPPPVAPVRSFPRLSAPVVAVLIAALILLVLFIPGVLIFPNNAREQAAVDQQAEALRDGNRTLEQRLKELKDANRQQMCRLPDNKLAPVSPAPNGGVVTPQADPLPPSPEHVQAAPPSGGSALTVSQVFENSVVFIFGPKRGDDNSASWGTGFFVTPNKIATNRHVVDGIANGKIFVTNRAFGRAVPGKLVAETPPDAGEEGASGMSVADLAVVEVEGEHPFMKLGASAEKGMNVLAVGYPGLMTENQPLTNRLLNGDLSAAPDSTYMPGIVTTRFEGAAVKTILHSASITHGNSGGPLADLCGRVVGVNTLVATDNIISTSFAQDVSELEKYLKSVGVAATVDTSACVPQVAAAPTPAPSATPAPTPGASPPAPSPTPSK